MLIYQRQSYMFLILLLYMFLYTILTKPNWEQWAKMFSSAVAWKFKIEFFLLKILVLQIWPRLGALSQGPGLAVAASYLPLLGMGRSLLEHMIQQSEQKLQEGFEDKLYKVKEISRDLATLVMKLWLKAIVEEKLAVIIFHCREEDMRKLIESSLFPGWSIVRGQSFFLSISSVDS